MKSQFVGVQCWLWSPTSHTRRIHILCSVRTVLFFNTCHSVGALTRDITANFVHRACGLFRQILLSAALQTFYIQLLCAVIRQHFYIRPSVYTDLKFLEIYINFIVLNIEANICVISNFVCLLEHNFSSQSVWLHFSYSSPNLKACR
jgi:hypothetical protein